MRQAVCILRTDDYKMLKSFYEHKSPYYDKLVMKTGEGKEANIYGYWKNDRNIFFVSEDVIVANRVDLKQKEYLIFVGSWQTTLETEKWLDTINDKENTVYLLRLRGKISKAIKKDERRENKKPKICILRTVDYAVFKRNIETNFKTNLKENVMSINKRGGDRKDILGVLDKRSGWFVTSVEHIGDFEEIDLQKCNMRRGTLEGQIGSALNPLKIVMNPMQNEVLKLFQDMDGNIDTKNGTANTKKKSKDMVVATERAYKKKAPPKGINISTALNSEQVIHLYSRKCHCSKCAGLYKDNTIVNCTATVQSLRGGLVPVSVMFCTGCDSFFMNYDTYSAYSRKYGGLKFRCQIDKSSMNLKPEMNLAKDSFLSRAGYSVNAHTPRSQRQETLAYLIDSGKATKWEITEKISEFIQRSSKNESMKEAVIRWEEDIAFVADYDTGKQAKVGQATFRQGGKITRR